MVRAAADLLLIFSVRKLFSFVGGVGVISWIVWFVVALRNYSLLAIRLPVSGIWPREVCPARRRA